MKVLRGKSALLCRRLFVLLGILALGAGWTPRVEGQDFQLSPERMFDVLMASRHCAAYRGTYSKSVAEFKYRREALATTRKIIALRQAEFEACVVERGGDVPTPGDERGVQLAAEICPEAFESLVRVRLNLIAQRQDHDELKGQLGLLKAQISDDCAGQKSE